MTYLCTLLVAVTLVKVIQITTKRISYKVDLTHSTVDMSWDNSNPKVYLAQFHGHGEKMV